MPTALLLLDLSTTFDTIDHDTLLSCLSVRFGFAGSVLFPKVLSWVLFCFPSTQHPLVKSSENILELNIGSAVSDLFKLKFGVPQGSVFVLDPVFPPHYIP